MAISVGSVEVDVVPNARGIYARLKSQLEPAAARAGEDAGRRAGERFGQSMAGAIDDSVATRIGQQIGRQIARHITTQVRDSIGTGVRQGGQRATTTASRQGSDAGGAFGRAFRGRVQAAMQALPRADVRLSDTGLGADLARVRSRLETLSDKRIGIDVDPARALAEIETLDAELARLGSRTPDVQVRMDTAAARAELARLRQEIDRTTATPARVRVEPEGAFAQRLRAAVQAAQASLPDIQVDANTAPAQRQIAAIRGSLALLADAHIGVDLDAGAALAQIAALQAQLQALSASDVDVQVRVDTAAARAQLAALRAQIALTEANDVDIDVDIDTGAAMAALLQLGVGIAALGAIPVLPVVAAGIGSIAAAAVSASVGVAALGAVAAPAFLDIARAAQAQTAAQGAAATATAQSGQAAVQAASRALQLAGAQQALAAAERNGARQIASAQRQVRQARQAAADAAADGARRQEQAARAVADAERALADAQRDARRAQQDLTAARREAAADLEDLAHRAASARLAERDAALSVREAEADLRRVREDPEASGLDRQRAQLGYEQAVQRLAEQRLATQRLAEQQAEASRSGVEGTDRVRQAQERLAQAQEQVADRALGVRDAQDEAARVQVETARQVAQAQQRVSEATEQVAVAQQSAADAVASAQRQIASAQLAAAGGADAAAAAQAAYQEELAAMTPATRETYDSFLRLRDAFGEWSRSLQPAVMPIFTRALDGLRNSLPGVTPFVLEAAEAVSGLQDRISKGLESEGWQEFKDDLLGSVKPAIEGVGVALGNIAVGAGGVIQAFLPHMDSISERMQDITGRFADWGTGLKGSPEFERFLSFASEHAGPLGDALSSMGGAALDFVQALAPLSEPVLEILSAVADFVGTLVREFPELIQMLYLVWLGTRLWAIAQVALNLVMAANPILLTVLAIGALVAALVWAYRNVEDFRTGVDEAWADISEAASAAWVVVKPILQGLGTLAVWVWRYLLRPQLKAIETYFRIVGAVATWLWRNAVKPAFEGIGERAKWLWRVAIKPAVDAIRGALRRVGEAATWLWERGIRPVFRWIGDRATWLWEEAIRPAFRKIRDGVDAVAEAFRTGKDNIKRHWDRLKDVAKSPVNFVIETVYNNGIRRLWNRIADIVGAPTLGKIDKLATGGILPGYTPGRDVHLAALSGGEAVMRPEWTRAVGADYVHGMNAAARRGGVAGVQQAMGVGGAPGFSGGGIFGAVGDVVGGVIDWTRETGAEWLGRSLRGLLDSTLGRMPGLDTGWGRFLRRLPEAAVDRVMDWIAGREEETTTGAGAWLRPVDAPISTRYGVRGRMWSSGYHTGTDFAAPTGTLVRAVADGIVSSTSNGGPYGIHMRLAHAGGMSSLYAHLSRIVAPKGTTVHRGDVIGRVGSTGNSTGPHLHLEAFRAHHGRINPETLFDSGGYLKPGLNLAYNGTGRPEPVLTVRQLRALEGAATAPRTGGPTRLEGDLYLDSGEFMGTVRGTVREELAPVATALKARPRR